MSVVPNAQRYHRAGVCGVDTYLPWPAAVSNTSGVYCPLTSTADWDSYSFTNTPRTLTLRQRRHDMGPEVIRLRTMITLLTSVSLSLINTGLYCHQPDACSGLLLTLHYVTVVYKGAHKGSRSVRNLSYDFVQVFIKTLCKTV